MDERRVFLPLFTHRSGLAARGAAVHFCRAGMAAALLAISVLPAVGQSVSLDIAATSLGLPPADFEFWRTGSGHVGQWEVVKDDTASRGRAIEQLNTDATNYRFPLAIYKPISARNVEVTVRFKAMAGKVDQAGGIAVRLTTPDDYYVVRANALENNVRFYRVVKGKREQIAGADLKVTSNAWHTLRLKAQAQTFTVSFNGREIFSARDATLTAAGKIALWTKADSVTRFDQIQITSLD
jgi:hypothetical protein